MDKLSLLDDDQLDGVLGGRSLEINMLDNDPYGVFDHKTNKLIKQFPPGQGTAAVEYARSRNKSLDVVNLATYPNWPRR